MILIRSKSELPLRSSGWIRVLGWVCMIITMAVAVMDGTAMLAKPQ